MLMYHLIKLGSLWGLWAFGPPHPIKKISKFQKCAIIKMLPLVYPLKKLQLSTPTIPPPAIKSSRIACAVACRRPRRYQAAPEHSASKKYFAKLFLSYNDIMIVGYIRQPSTIIICKAATSHHFFSLSEV